MGQGAQSFDVVDDCRLAMESGNGRKGRPGAGHPALPFDRGDERGLLAADKGAGPLLDPDVEAEVRPQDVLPEDAELPHLDDRFLQSLDGQRVFGADVDIALTGADRVGGDEHPFEDGVGVALDQGPVHEGSGVALVGVADEVALVARHFPAGQPLPPGRKSRPAAAAQAGPLDRVQDFSPGQ